MKCTLAQAGQVTDTWRSCASFDVSSNQCCTFIPVWGHLNKIGRSMARMMPAHLDCRYSVSIRRQSDRLSGKTGHAARAFVEQELETPLRTVRVTARPPCHSHIELKLNIDATLNHFKKEHIANIEQTWYKFSISSACPPDLAARLSR